MVRSDYNQMVRQFVQDARAASSRVDIEDLTILVLPTTTVRWELQRDNRVVVRAVLSEWGALIDVTGWLTS